MFNFSFTTKIKTYIGIAGGFLLVIIVFYTLISTADWKTVEILAPYQQADAKIDTAVASFKADGVFISPDKLDVLRNQYEVARFKKEHNLEIIQLMNSYYFASTMLLLALSIILGIFILQISGSGIQSKTHRFKAFFFSILALTTFFGILIQVMNHQENIMTNKKSFLAFSSTQLRIYNFLMTDGQELRESKKKVADTSAVDTIPMDIDDFITSINREINQTDNIFLKITHDKIQDYNEIISIE